MKGFAIACKRLCDRDPRFRKSMTRHIRLPFCKQCDRFVNTDSLSCPCCKKQLKIGRSQRRRGNEL